MPATPQQTEAIRLIGDWSKWIAAVETGAIASVGVFSKSSPETLVPFGFRCAIICFVGSIALASMVLISLPAAVQDISERDKVWDRVCTLGPLQPLLRTVVAGQFCLFVLGIVAYGLTIAGIGFVPFSPAPPDHAQQHTPPPVTLTAPSSSSAQPSRQLPRSPSPAGLPSRGESSRVLQ